MKYLLGTGRHKVSPEWEEIWRSNIPPSIEQFACIRVGCTDRTAASNYIDLVGNLGHVGDLLNGSKPYEFCGWSSTVLALAMIAYSGECDLLYKEQDCLAFGPWVEQMYADMGDGDMVFGRKMNGPPWMPSAQSLFLIRHGFIPQFVSRYLAMGKDGDYANLPETKFANLEGLFPGRIRRLSFGYDRERPINFDDPVWYAQKFSPAELEELKRRNLI